MSWLRNVLLVGWFLPVFAWSLTFTVNDNGDGVDLNAGDGVCRAVGTTTCTLRAAIMEANGSPGPHEIAFNLPSGARTITPASPFPPLSSWISVDGYTQPGSVPNTGTNIDDSVVFVVIDGGSITGGTANPNTDGLIVVDGVGVSVRGLDLRNGGNIRSGVIVRAGLGHISGNHIDGFANGILLRGAGVVSTDVGESGRNVLTNNQVGVLIDEGASENRIAGN